MITRAATPRRVVISALLFLSWLGLAVLLIATKGDLERSLLAAFARRSRPDTFRGVNVLAIPFGVLHSCLALLAIAAAWRRRTDVLTVLLIGPALGLAIGLACQDWADPNVHDLLSIFAIGWLVGTVVGLAYWAYSRGPGDDLAGR